MAYADKEAKRIFAALPGLLLPWYAENARTLPWRRDREPYHVWVSEIMLQQTRVEAVRGYYERFLNALPDIPSLAAAPEETLLKLWEGLGYYSRARNLQKAAKRIVAQYGGEFPRDYDSVRALPGVGDYTAGAICSICFESPAPAVDGNVLRIAARMCSDSAPIDLPATKKAVASALKEVYPKGRCGDFTQSLMELGACVCMPKVTKCDICPVREICLSHAHGTQNTLPVKLPKREKRVEPRTVFLLECDGAYAIHRREGKGLLAGLWQFPNTEGQLSPSDALQAAESFGVKPIELLRETHKTHIFTHIRWEMVGYHIRCREKNGIFLWATPEELRSTYALPTAFRIFLDDAQI
ncbi:MAG TPA: A/G-specific adenine glycosylase [Candidatus Fimenecus excrementigallinarum]|uniref:Adenine DNA glycosylase n=1 Tax=Candidatus Fimenecus excrementigallinarum TaxID=2840816 RepID=A0A9D1LEH8_9FIRM|nr:A/G-specific adenine glycosylase [Candidatus Fimenecus excrementigallinarum]